MLSDQNPYHIDTVVHAANSLPAGSEIVARLLHRVLDAAINNPAFASLTPDEFKNIVWSEVALLRCPPVILGVGDTLLADKLEPHALNWLLLPTNTSLDSSSKLVAAAKYAFNPVHFEELKQRAPANLGDVFESHRSATTVDALIHLVCRKDDDPVLRAIDLCFSKLPSRPGMYFTLPIWQAKQNLTLWTDLIVNWIRLDRESGLKSKPVLYIRYENAEREVAEQFERALICKGVLVGREVDVKVGAFSFQDAQTLKPIPKEFDLLATQSGNFTPEIYASWMRSGLRMPDEVWRRHYQILTATVP